MVVTDGAQAKEFKGFMSQDLRMPKYELFKAVKPERDGQLYPEKWPPSSNVDFEEKVGAVIGSMSLFAPRSHEEGKLGHQILLERPVTPVNEEIKAPPTSFNQLVTFIRRRIAAKQDTPYLSVEDQQNLAGILMGEVNGIWPEVRKQVDDPFMTPVENRELNRRISVYIVTVCERLFKHYLQKATVLNSRGVFSGPANMCRLRAQLALDANKLLNVLTVRRYIVSDMRGRGQRDSTQSAGIKTAQANPLSFTSLMQTIRPTDNVKRTWNKTPTAEIEAMCAKMPSLDPTKLLRLLEDLPERLTDRSGSEGKGPSKIPSQVSEVESRPSVILEELSRRLVLDKRSHSLPFLRGVGETLLEELDVLYEKMKPDATYDVADLLTGTKHYQSQKKPEEPVDDGLTQVESDLKQLLARSKEIDENMCAENDSEDLPALLQAMTRSRKHDGLKERLERQLIELEENQRKDELKEKVTIREPAHPQPDTVTSKLNSQMPIKTSDIRVSERVCMSSVTLQSYATVYNDLQDEISGNMILELDKNLFLEDEIKEVYKEVMKSVPTKHLNMEQDSLVKPSADHVDLSYLMPSSTLNRRKASRLINPNLERHTNPPWGDEDAMHWVKTPLSPPKNLKGEEQFRPETPNMEKIADILKAKNNDFKINENMPPAVAEKMARTYASWYQWWKNTVSTDDYMKYISTQDTDFLGVSYHFYDSDDPDGVDDPSPALGANFPQYMRPTGGKPLSRDAQPPIGYSAAQSLNLEREKKLTEMKVQKTEYKEGFWNVNSVLMGGLGKEPVLEEKEPISHGETPDSDSSRRAKQTLKARAQARHSAKSRRMSDAGAQLPSTSASRRSDSVFSQSYRASPIQEKPLTPQERLEKVWNALCMPDGQRLDMAIKYSSDQYFKVLEQAMEKWEQVTRLILQRESILSTLEKFERTASDPNRFFVKGQKGSSAARLDEARERSYYYRKIEDLDDDIKLELDYIKNNFNDDVSYKGRPFVDKMKWDRIEMLYWLGEERKHNAIKYEASVKQIPLKTTHLDPILLESRG